MTRILIDWCVATHQDRVDYSREMHAAQARPKRVSVNATVDYSPRRWELLRGTHFGERAVDLVALQFRHFLGVVHVAEVGCVYAVLGQLLPRSVNRVFTSDHLCKSRWVIELWDLWNFPHWSNTLGVIPSHDKTVALDRWIGRNAGLFVCAIRIGDQGVLALGIKAPTVERAHKFFADD